MKKILVSLLALALAVSMAACSNDAQPEESTEESEVVGTEESEEGEEPTEGEESEEGEEPTEGEESEEGEEAAPVDGDIVGKWVGTTIEAEGITLSIQDFTQAYGMEMEISFEFKEDGTVVGIVRDDEEDMEENGTYEVNGNEIAVTFDGETEIMTLEEAGLVLEMEGMRFILTK